MLFSPQILSGKFGAKITEASSFLARTSGLDSTHQSAFTALINGLVADSIFATRHDVLHIYATQDSTSALVNLPSSNYNGTIPASSPTFNADLGFTGANDATHYINTNFNPSTASAPLYTRNSAHLSVWCVTNSGTDGTPMIGQLDGGHGESDIYPRYTDGKAYGRVQSGVTGGFTTASPRGHWVVSRTTSSQVDVYKDGVSVLSLPADTSNILTNLPFFALGLNSNTTPVGNAQQCAAISIGAGLTSTEVGNFYTRMRTYMTAVGVP